MTVPTKLIDTTMEEFKAENYDTRTCSTTCDYRGDGKYVQVVQLIFEKEVTNET